LVIAALAVGGCDDSTTVRITFLGNGTGAVAIFDPRSGVEEACAESCELTYPSGFVRLTVFVTHNVRSTLIELGGPDLTPSAPESPHIGTVGPLEGDDLEITARFTPWTEAPMPFARSGGFGPDGDLIVGTALGVAKVSLAGDVAWSTPLLPDDTEFRQLDVLAVTPLGESYVVKDYPRTLFKLDAAGEERWSTPLSDAFHDLAALPDGDVVIVDESLHRISGATGSERWSMPVVAGEGVAVAPSGVIYVARRERGATPVTGEIVRFTEVGLALTPGWPVPADLGARIALAVDHESALLVLSYELQRLDPTTGAVLYAHPISDPELSQFNTATTQPGVAVTSTNQAFVWWPRIVSGSLGVRWGNGTNLRAIGTTGAPTWSGGFPSIESVGQFPPDAAVVRSGGCDRTMHCAVFGSVPATVFDVP